MIATAAALCISVASSLKKITPLELMPCIGHTALISSVIATILFSFIMLSPFLSLHHTKQPPQSQTMWLFLLQLSIQAMYIYAIPQTVRLHGWRWKNLQCQTRRAQLLRQQPNSLLSSQLQYQQPSQPLHWYSEQGQIRAFPPYPRQLLASPPVDWPQSRWLAAMRLLCKSMCLILVLPSSVLCGGNSSTNCA